MPRNFDKEYVENAEIFKALSHPTRLFVVHAINGTPRSVRELADMVGIDISTMSKHLDILKRNRIIKGEKKKNYIYYRLAIPCVLEFMRCAARVRSGEG